MARKKADKKADEATVVHNATQTLVKKVWGFCHTLRDDGVGASEYLEQLTYLLFLKMIDELGKEIPAEYSWPVLRTKSGSELSEYYTEKEFHYREIAGNHYSFPPPGRSGLSCI